MAKPVILTVDDEEQVRNAVERDLKRYYGKKFRIIKAGSGAEGMQTVHELKKRNDAVALFLVDQRMPEMSGTQFLAEALGVYPDARTVLLTAYADTEAAISAINDIGLDHYLMKPWTPPDRNLYPILDDLIDDWEAVATVPYDGIRVAGTLWSASSHNVKHFLARGQIPYQFLDIERDAEARALVNGVVGDSLRLPVIFFPDGTTMIEPEVAELAEKVGMQTHASKPYYELIVVGAGPAGLAAAVYGASEGIHTLLIEKETPGGQAGTSASIENYLGFPKGLSGADLARRATAQATRFGAEILSAQEVVGVDVRDTYRIVTLATGKQIACRAVVIATGVSVRRLDVPGIDKLTGAGVYYGAAQTEAASYKGEHVLLVGGANSAGQGAVFLSNYARQVTMLVRRPLEATMSRYLIDQIEKRDNIDVMTPIEVAGVQGEQRLESVEIRNMETGETQRVSSPAMFVFIGTMPHTEMLGDLVSLSPDGFVLTGPDLPVDGMRPPGWRLKRDPYLMETNVPGILAAGDVRHGVIRRVASAVGQGSAAINFVHEYLKTV